MTRTIRRKAQAQAAAVIPTAAGNQGPRAILYLLFALSGLVGLVYEATWTRYLQLFLGHAAYAQVLVISLFMGGMGAGALLAGRLSRGRIAPLVAYAAIEAALGVAALAFHPLFDGATTFAYETLIPRAPGPAAAEAIQWLLAAALIVPQSVLLGMTFPLMSGAILRLGSQQGGRVFAMLYFSNSAGAVIGVLLAGFWLFEHFGLQATMVMAGAVNLVIAGIAMTLARRRPAGLPAVIRTPSAATVGRWLLLFAFLTAVASFFYEIAWLRMLALVQGSSTHAFETMLSAFILGIALGGLWVRKRIERFRSPMAVLAGVQVLMGLAALATLPAYNFTFDFMQVAMERLPRDGAGYAGYNMVGYLLSAGIMVPASFFAGMTLPLLTYVLYRQGRGESEIGAVYGWNTLGSIAGVALGGLVLMPMIGLKNLVVAGAALDIGLGFALAAHLLCTREWALGPRPTAVIGGVAIAALATALAGLEFDLTRMLSGVFRHGSARLESTSRVVSYADGRTATVSMVASEDGRLSIATNGKVDAAINMKPGTAPNSDEFTMTLLGALPLAHAPGARKAAIIGHGSGLTTHVVLASPVIEQVDVIEIEPEMVEAARAFLPRVARAYEDPRGRLHIQDARAFFARSGQRYDFIVSEPSNPWISGVASLFTPEFYGQARKALAPGGLFVQWFHLYEIARPQVMSIIGAIAAVFPDYVLYVAGETDVVLVASASGAVPPARDTLFGWPDMRRDLARLGIHTPAQLRLHQVANRRAYAPLLEGGPVNSDYFPTLEFGAARARFLRTTDLGLTQLAADAVPVLEMLSGFAAPESTASSATLAGHLARFADVARANAFAAGLRDAAGSATPESMPQDDRRLLQRVRDLRANTSEATWDDWFFALLTVAKPMVPNGAAPALASFIRSGPVADQLSRATPEIREKVEFLLLVAARDLGRIRQQGPVLLAGTLQGKDPAFHTYTLVATITACLTAPAESGCRRTIALLDTVQRRHPMFDLLRAHQRALR